MRECHSHFEMCFTCASYMGFLGLLSAWVISHSISLVYRVTPSNRENNGRLQWVQRNGSIVQPAGQPGCPSREQPAIVGYCGPDQPSFVPLKTNPTDKGHAMCPMSSALEKTPSECSFVKWLITQSPKTLMRPSSATEISEKRW